MAFGNRTDLSNRDSIFSPRALAMLYSVIIYSINCLLKFISKKSHSFDSKNRKITSKKRVK